MIPIQDVVPSGRLPAVTLALMGLNVVSFLATSTGASVIPPFAHGSLLPFLLAVLFLWLFGDNAEARVGRIALALIYLAGGLMPGIGAAGAVTAVMGSYFVLLPQSRVLMLAPTPTALVEVPAAFLLGVWAVLHLLRFVQQPRSIWMFLAAFVVGAVVARLVARPVQWN